MKTRYSALFLIACAAMAHGAPRTSANYTLAAETADCGGRKTASPNYTNDGSAGGIAGVAAVAPALETSKSGYVGQLFDITGLALQATPASVNETASCQLGACQVLDDGDMLELSASSVAWSVVSGPIASISAAGLATAAAVYQTTDAKVQAVCGGLSASLNLTVLDTLPDNFGSYAGDGLDDSWQARYFGVNNPAAGSSQDPDGDGQTNQFEFCAGVVPTDPSSRFQLRIEPVPGQPTSKRLVFSPRWPDRTYTILTNSSLQATGWTALTGAITSDNGTERTVTDTNASASHKYYRVQIAKP